MHSLERIIAENELEFLRHQNKPVVERRGGFKVDPSQDVKDCAERVFNALDGDINWASTELDTKIRTDVRNALHKLTVSELTALKLFVKG